MRAFAVILSLSLVGCPPADQKEKAKEALGPCKSFGQTCEVSPGKLGTCVTKEPCTEPPPACFVCQSQH